MRKFFPVLLILLVQAFPTVSFSEAPQRIIPLSPSVAEILYGIGAWEKVVGVTIYSDFPPEAKNLPKVGGWVNPNLEAIVALRPELIIMVDEQERIFGEKLRKIGLETLAVKSKTFGDIINAILTVGRAIGREKVAKKVAEDVKLKIDEIRQRTKSLNQKKVLFVVGRNPGALSDIYAIAPGSFIDEIITAAGGENVMKESKGFTVNISKEAVLILNPEVIVEINPGKNEKEALKVWNELSVVSAVKNGEVHIIEETAFLHPSQRVIEGTQILAKILHPEAFGSE